MRKLLIILFIFLSATLKAQIIRASANYVSLINVTYKDILGDGNTVAWYKADSLETITKSNPGDPNIDNLVSAWKDCLGSGNDLGDGTNAWTRPIWSANGILFDGSNDFMKTAAFTLNQPVTIYIVLKVVSFSAWMTIIDGGTANYGALLERATTPTIGAFAGTNALETGDLAVNTWGIVTIVFNGASSSIQVDNHDAVTGDAGSANPGGIVIGANISGTANSNIQVEEIIYRKVADSSPNKILIQNYLKAEYGL
jgi:hypothetical protein